jgi:hypothetical protein
LLRISDARQEREGDALVIGLRLRGGGSYGP